METVKGRLDQHGTFYLRNEEGEHRCAMYSTRQEEASEPRPFDVSHIGACRVIVTCQVVNSDTLWGVTDVSVDFDG